MLRAAPSASRGEGAVEQGLERRLAGEHRLRHRQQRRRGEGHHRLDLAPRSSASKSTASRARSLSVDVRVGVVADDERRQLDQSRPVLAWRSSVTAIGRSGPVMARTRRRTSASTSGNPSPTIAPCSVRMRPSAGKAAFEPFDQLGDQRLDGGLVREAARGGEGEEGRHQVDAALAAAVDDAAERNGSCRRRPSTPRPATIVHLASGVGSAEKVCVSCIKPPVISRTRHPPVPPGPSPVMTPAGYPAPSSATRQSLPRRHFGRRPSFQGLGLESQRCRSVVCDRDRVHGGSRGHRPHRTERPAIVSVDETQVCIDTA